MRRKWFTAIIVLVLIALNVSISAQEPTFSVSMVRNENQISDNSYFNLLVKPGSSHTLKVEVYNNTDKQIEILTEVVNASTAVNGSDGNYLKDSPIDRSLKYPLTTLLEPSGYSVISAKTKKVLEFNLISPGEVFDGKIIGAIRFSSNVDEEAKPSDDNAFVFENKFGFVLGVQLQNNLAVPAKNLNLLSNGISALHFKPVFATTIQNDKAVHMGLVEIFGEIYDSKKNVVAKVDVKQSQILPNTSFDVAYTPVGNKIESGKYSMYLKIRHHDDIWEWQENFTISLGDVDKVNDEVQQVYPDTSPNYLPWIIGLISLFILIIILLLFLLFKRRKKDEEEETLDYE